jgi:hypothetical protein
LVAGVVLGGYVEVIEGLLELGKGLGLGGDRFDVFDGPTVFLADDLETLIGQPLLVLSH